jgi:hypothetical protein
MKDWQFNVLFFVGVGGAILLLLGPEFGLKVAENPTAFTGVGAILTYILTQRIRLETKRDKKKQDDEDRRQREVDNGPS